jgi:four helix bundle protein
MDLYVEGHGLTRAFPRDEMFCLTSQMRRCLLSIPSNLSEGTERDSLADRRRFVTSARGSLAEVETQLIAARRLGYIDGASLRAMLTRTDRIGRMLTQLRRNIRARPSLETGTAPPKKRGKASRAAEGTSETGGSQGDQASPAREANGGQRGDQDR